jgi:predicted nucleic acid-binding protein
MILTYLDSGVLITLFRASDNLAIKAQEILDDPNREFASSAFVKLETISKAAYHKQQDEVNFYETFFASCQLWANDYNTIIQLAENLANKYGLNGLDALQVASAISVNAQEFVTTEKPSKPLHRVTEIRTISLVNN